MVKNSLDTGHVCVRKGKRGVQGIPRLHVRIQNKTGTVLAKCRLQRFAGPNESKKESKRFLRGRKMANEIDFTLVRNWLHICEEQHGVRCVPKAVNVDVGLALTLIDTNARMLIPASKAGDFKELRYAALSYVWGPPDVEQLKNIAFNGIRSRLSTPGGLGDHWDDIPITIKDAITVCEKIGISYLWVDALCIQQDEEIGKEVLGTMNDIYLGACLTIVNAAGSNSWANLPGVRPGSRSIDQSISRIGEFWIGSTQREGNKKVYESIWATRAWTLQEGVLSTRLLIFTPDDLLFDCHDSKGWYESMHLEAVPGSGKSILPIRTIHNLSIFDPNYVTTDNPNTALLALQRLARDYARRHLTKESDCLRAFTGIINAFANQMGAPFIFGVPLWHFLEVLLFEVDASVIHRRHQFPSWSWIEWKLDSNSSYTYALTSPRFEGQLFDEDMVFYRFDAEESRRSRESGIDKPVFSAVRRTLHQKRVQHLLATAPNRYPGPEPAGSWESIRRLDHALIFEAESACISICRDPIEDKRCARTDGMRTFLHVDDPANAGHTYENPVLYQSNPNHRGVTLDAGWRQKQPDEL